MRSDLLPDEIAERPDLVDDEVAHPVGGVFALERKVERDLAGGFVRGVVPDCEAGACVSAETRV